MKAIILDRDGVINKDSDDYIKSPEEWSAIKGSLEAMGKLTAAGYQIFVITNQSGIARKLFTVGELTRIHRKMIEEAKKYGAHIDAILYCPHGPDDNCECRKPNSGLFLELGDRLNASLTDIPAIGDSVRDLIAASNAKASPILVLTGKGRKSKKEILASDSEQLKNIPIFKNLADYVNQLLTQ